MKDIFKDVLWVTIGTVVSISYLLGLVCLFYGYEIHEQHKEQVICIDMEEQVLGKAEDHFEGVR